MMRELNIAQSILENRRRLGVTQDQLADFAGVSKTAVSKWETGATYPDITLLPRLAAFFHISIDQLMNYQPQLSPEELRRLCQELAKDFAARPFPQVMERCRELAKKYWACPQLLLQLAGLYANHCALAGEPPAASAILEEALVLFARVRELSDSASLLSQAAALEGFCLLRLGRGEEAVQLLEDTVSLRLCPEVPLAEAYEVTGRPQESRRILQAGIYQSVLELLNLQSAYLRFCPQEGPAFDETLRRILALAEAFQLERLHPGVLLTMYLTAAQECLRRRQPARALDMLDQYRRLALSDIYPLRLRGDHYFDLLDGWLEEELAMGSAPPRDEAAIRRDIFCCLGEIPAFGELREDPRFQEIVRSLEREGRKYR